MGALAAFPVLIITLMLQLAIISRLPLLHGTADLMLLVLVAWALQERVRTAWFWTLLGGVMVTLVSGLPFYMPVFGYLIATGVARLLRRQVWQTQLLAMFVTTFAATLIYHALSLAVLQIAGRGLPISDSLTLVTLPSALINLMLALPVYTLITDLAHWLYPAEIA